MGNATQQKLIQPQNNMRVTASYKNAEYLAKLDVGVHYGMDCADKTRSNYQIYGMGDGVIVDVGTDTCFGNYIVVKYPQAYNHIRKRYADIIVRMYHFASVSVKKGQAITKDTKMGLYGSTGTYAASAHLHMEVDEDTVNTHYTPSIKNNTSKFKGRSAGANDLTMSNPLEWMHCKTSAPDKQTYTTDGNAYINDGDKSIPVIG